ncbi:unnamed protein product, partial [Mesorhabditis spiculigera]
MVDERDEVAALFEKVESLRLDPREMMFLKTMALAKSRTGQFEQLALHLVAYHQIAYAGQPFRFMRCVELVSTSCENAIVDLLFRPSIRDASMARLIADLLVPPPTPQLTMPINPFALAQQFALHSLNPFQSGVQCQPGSSTSPSSISEGAPSPLSEPLNLAENLKRRGPKIEVDLDEEDSKNDGDLETTAEE